MLLNLYASHFQSIVGMLHKISLNQSINSVLITMHTLYTLESRKHNGYKKASIFTAEELNCISLVFLLMGTSTPNILPGVYLYEVFKLFDFM